MTSEEALGKIKKLIFIIGEILVAESKQDISPEEAIQRIRKICNKYGINGTDYGTIKQDLDRLEKLEKVIEILKKALLLNVKEVRGIYFTLAYDNNYVMTKEEYDLLKGVLENDSNKRIH